MGGKVLFEGGALSPILIVVLQVSLNTRYYLCHAACSAVLF